MQRLRTKKLSPATYPCARNRCFCIRILCKSLWQKVFARLNPEVFKISGSSPSTQSELSPSPREKYNTESEEIFFFYNLRCLESLCSWIYARDKTVTRQGAKDKLADIWPDIPTKLVEFFSKTCQINYIVHMLELYSIHLESCNMEKMNKSYRKFKIIRIWKSSAILLSCVPQGHLAITQGHLILIHWAIHPLYKVIQSWEWVIDPFNRDIYSKLYITLVNSSMPQG